MDKEDAEKFYKILYKIFNNKSVSKNKNISFLKNIKYNYVKFQENQRKLPNVR